ncbi:MAG: carotenoid biosynthesis protein [Myxococcota bacterium]|nr:carotenoid biosynthesis protein [Myxococcota bacterium]
MNKKPHQLNLFKGLAIIYAVGLIGHLVPLFRPMLLPMTPYVLLLTGAVVIFPLVRERRIRTLLWVWAVGMVAFGIEVVGVKTGAVFGQYAYGEVLGFKLWGVPLIIGFNWMLVVLGAVSGARLVVKRRAAVVCVAGLLALLFDLVLEPTAIALHYWTWYGQQVPVQNYAVWTGLTMIAAAAYSSFGCQHNERLPAFYLLVLFVYFAVLTVILPLLNT